MWEKITVALASLGLESAGLGQTPSAQSAGSGDNSAPQKDEDLLVEYEGMLVSAAAAQRRR
jgi:hypothetical protein